MFNKRNSIFVAHKFFLLDTFDPGGKTFGQHRSKLFRSLSCWKVNFDLCLFQPLTGFSSPIITLNSTPTIFPVLAEENHSHSMT